MRVFLLLPLLVAIALADDCLMICPMDYTPLCGEDGVTYGNQCELKSVECMKKTTIKVLHDGECTEEDKPKPVPINKVSEKCLRPCPAIYSPVCGSDGVTYPGECEMKVAACNKNQKITVAFEGECKEQEKPKPVLFQNEATDKCARACPKIYSPVCGTDGETYANECEMEAAACRKKKDIKIAYQGECGKPQPEPYKQQKDDCLRPCTLDYNPECGTDGVTYPNKCSRETTACQKKIKIDLAYKGECMKKEPRRKLKKTQRNGLFP